MINDYEITWYVHDIELGLNNAHFSNSTLALLVPYIYHLVCKNEKSFNIILLNNILQFNVYLYVVYMKNHNDLHKV